MREFLKEIYNKMSYKIKDIENWQARKAYYPKTGEYEYLTDWNDFKIGDEWSEDEGITTFFKSEVYLPKIEPENKLVLHIETGGEAALYIDNELIQGLDRNHSYVTLNNKFFDKKVELFIEAALDRINKIYVPDPDYKHILSNASLIAVNKPAEEFYYNILSLIELIESLQENDNSSAPDQLLEIFSTLRKDYRSFSETKINFNKLNTKHNNLIENIDYDTPYKIACFGHAHIDVAWLWQFKETVRKSARSFSTAVNLMEEYPEFKFIQSQPKLYQYMKEYYPNLYKKIKDKVVENNWQVEGGMWVEADTNLLNGESLVRQFLYGKKFIREEFNVESKVCWLPDVFGYTASLPQIMKKSEIDYFMTSKISWNDTNDFPYSVFHWEGIDGTNVLTHVPRVLLPYTYNGEVEADKIIKVRDNYEKQKENEQDEFKYGDSSNYFKQDRVIPDDQLIYIYGYGDGGGGVTPGFINKIKRFDKLPYMPKLEFAQPREYFENLEEDMKINNREYPTWKGELYLEYHRGTYTTQAEIKLQNRRLEDNIREAEILNTITEQYPQSKFEELWKKINLNQFHDIIPGSSIEEVYEDVNEIYADVTKEINDILANTLNTISKNINIKSKDNSTFYLIWNGLDYNRSCYIQFKAENFDNYIEVFDYTDGKELDYNIKNNLKGEKIFEVYIDNVPSIGYKIIEVRKNTDQKLSTNSKLEKNNIDKSIENRYYKLEFEEGKITSLYDKRREVELIVEGKAGNELQFFVDKPDKYEAWEQDADFEDHRIFDELELENFEIEKHNTQKVAHLKWSFRKSVFEQNIILYDNIDRIDIKNRVDWLDREILVKVAFPLNILSDQARYEIAYGNITRPTTNNTSYEKAQFEVPGHRWADLSEPGLGFSIINDCKYGYDIKDNLMRLTLLKSPNYPDETADYGLHEFTYSLYTHQGIYYKSKLLKHANDLNRPLLKKELETSNAIDNNNNLSYSFAKIMKGNSKLEVIKKSEQNPNEIILRLYEPYGGKDKVEIELAKNIQNATIVNLIENKVEEKVKYNNNKLSLQMDPFEIKTIKLKLIDN